MSEVFLGVIAVSVLVMAIIQVTAVVLTARAARRVGTLAEKLESDLRPVVAHLQAAASDAARSTALAATQVEKADRLLNDITTRVDRILSMVQTSVSGAGRVSGAWVAGFKAMVEAYRELRDAPPKRRAAPVDEEDSLFIG
jgi:Tfp pilus assembly protein FimV